MKAEKFHWDLPVWDRVIAKHQELCTKARKTRVSSVPEFQAYLDSEFDKGYRILKRYADFIGPRLHSAGFSATDIGIVLKLDADTVRHRLESATVPRRVVAVPQLSGDRAPVGSFHGDKVAGTVLRFLGRLEVSIDLIEEIPQGKLDKVPLDVREEWKRHLGTRIEKLQQLHSCLTDEGDV